ncbi:ABC transporter permease subunit [Salinibius halmophilus]|uniref:ABC transporter permease subunit n=1 Tax=Salinibius halmophilus TaxID=1853216 RepID=UPI000E673EFD|nr:ABC transporter permease subunit [Salinibius halmophilus]
MNKFSKTMLAVGLAFLYIPMLILVIYSFNESRLVTVWAGWSTKWYGELWQDKQLMAAVWRSLTVAFYSATASVFLAIFASVVMVRAGKFRGRTLFSGLITAPLVMPDVLLGLAMLLLFVSSTQAFGVPTERGLFTVWLAHTTLGLAYATVVISSRLKEMDPRIEEAAFDLGASALTVFTRITMPIIAPAIGAGWLLAFTLSLDDVVLASFVSGPGATTLPIEVFSSVRMGVSPMVNALATMILLVVSLFTMAAWYVLHKQSKRAS